MLHDLYYLLKPAIPRRLQIEARRILVNRQRRANGKTWPIDESACTPPDNWPGWPEGKKFALVLTHDVESAKGLSRVVKIMALEKQLGFKSGFKFVADDYITPPELMKHIKDSGFEIGLHGLTHGGNLFRSLPEFKKSAARINQVMDEWRAEGFRAPSIYHNLEWTHLLKIGYDSSTFDTDPFEPQPDGMRTIFPFWVPRSPVTEPVEVTSVSSNHSGFPVTEPVEVTSVSSNHSGYVELPYTLPQDFTLFVLLRESIDIWKKKLRWIAEKGGMALLITHPDYMNFGEHQLKADEYPKSYYEEFLEHVLAEYKGEYWQALPRDVASFIKDQKLKSMRSATETTPYEIVRPETAIIAALPAVSAASEIEPAVEARPEPLRAISGKKIWIDLDNSPHVPFFRPIMNELNKRGYETVITARDCFQVCGLADLARIRYNKIGRHYGKNPFMKVLGLVIRTLQLVPIALNNKPSLSVSHGSRAQLMASKILNIPSIVIMDYEFAEMLVRPSFFIIPELLSKSKVYQGHPFFQYPGIKEDIYVPDFVPDPGIIADLGLDPGKLTVTIRPPANEAHYHNPEAEKLFEHAINFLDKEKNLQMVILPRNEKTQTAYIMNTWPHLIKSRKIIIPDHAVDGLNLIWYSDLVISGGGTMNREAAALGVPVYSIFRGTIGAVDQYLEKNGRLVLLTSTGDIENKLNLRKRSKPDKMPRKSKTTLNTLVDEIVTVLEKKS